MAFDKEFQSKALDSNGHSSLFKRINVTIEDSIEEDLDIEDLLNDDEVFDIMESNAHSSLFISLNVTI